ncbi:hypothetical protein BK022_12435 [Methylorubrum extorquens]|uniref:Uncharacterized protein n=1 Tax=Methylorubrum extorquens TaxID=408 RepID=A0A1S1P5M6_METEX|nr:hypothetical protein BK022_12435 [Methylorubrum extorquens]
MEDRQPLDHGDLHPALEHLAIDRPGLDALLHRGLGLELLPALPTSRAKEALQIKPERVPVRTKV